jgi:hypothetical protein
VRNCHHQDNYCQPGHVAALAERRCRRDVQQLSY